MNLLEKVVCSIGVVWGFALSLVTAWFIRDRACETAAGIGAILGNDPFVIAIAVVIGVAVSSGAMYVIVQAVRSRPWPIRLAVKLLILGLPAIAVGHVVTMGLACLGAYERSVYFFTYFGVGATLNLCVGVVGIAAMNSIPEYKRVLGGGTKERACGSDAGGA